MALDNYTAITVKSGNTYHVRATIAGLDVVSASLKTGGGVTVNRVQYFARAVYTLTPKYRGILDLYAYRDGFDDPTDSARKKLRAEICDAAGIYAREHTAAMVDSYTDAIERIAHKAHCEAAELEKEAGKKRDYARGLYNEAAVIAGEFYGVDPRLPVDRMRARLA
jgi:hypothetical protein